MRPIIRTGRVAIALLILALAAGAFPETAAPGAAARKLATLGDIAAEGNASSLDYAKARNAAAAAAAAVPALVKAKSSTLAATYSYSSVKTGASDAGNSFGAALSIPLLDQVGLSASVSSDLSSIVSASLNPLAHSDARAQALIAYEKALAAEENAGRAAGRTAVKAALAWMGQIRQLATQEKVTALKQEAYEAAKASNAVDGAMTTLDDLVAALKDWSDSRSDLAKAQAAERKAETALYASLGSSRAEAEVVPLDTGTLSAALAALEASLAPASSIGAAESFSAKAASLDIESGKSKLASIWAFEPDLALSAGVSLSAAGTPAPTASARLTISLDDLKGEKRAEAKADLDIAVRTLALQKASDANDFDQAAATVDAAKLNSESRKMARDQSAELTDVAAYSYKSGSYSAIENETAVLALAAAEDAYFQALADEYSAWLDLGALAGK